MAEMRVDIAYDIRNERSIHEVKHFCDLLRGRDVIIFSMPVQGGGPHAECCPLPSVIVTDDKRGYLRWEGTRADEMMTKSDNASKVMEIFRTGFEEQAKARVWLAGHGME